MVPRRVPIVLIALVASVVACSPSPSASSTKAGQSDRAKPGPTRTLVIVDRHEPTDLGQKFLVQGGSDRVKRLFNAALAVIDNTGAAQPYLAESLPRLHTDSWLVSPDGKMTTTYRLKPGLTWQAGH